MKRNLFICVFILFTFLLTNAQWSGTNPVWTNSNVGIGTSSPSNSGLNVYNSTVPYIHLTNSTTGNTANDGSYLSQNGANALLGNQENGNLQLFVNNDMTKGLTILSGGNVGIGTSSPSNSGLNVYNSSIPYIHLTNSTTGNTANDGSYLSQNGSNALLGNQENGNLQLFVNNDMTKGLTILSGGNVGIGTSSPSNSGLNVYNSSIPYIHLTNSTTGNTANDGSYLSQNGSNALLGNQENGNLQLFVNNDMTKGLTILSGGNVGIGTSSPSNSGLNVYNSTVPYLHLTNTTTGNTTNDGSYLSQNGANTFLGNQEIGNLQLFVNNDVTKGITILSGGNVGIGTSNSLSNPGLNVYNSTVPYLHLTNTTTGNTTNDGSYLSQNGANTFLGNQEIGNLQLFVNNDVTKGITILSGGNVGIGTTAPAAILHINKSEGIILSETNTSRQLRIIPPIVSSYGIIQTSGTANGLLLKSSGGGSQLYLKDDGNVGIGTTSPTQKLDVSGSIAVKGSELITSDGSSNYLKTGNKLYIQTGTTTHVSIGADGKVGIGTTNPQNMLDVNGTIRGREIKASLDNWSDFVFDRDYKLLSLNYVENYIRTNNKLPDIPSAAEVTKDGVNLGDMNARLLQKVEELTLYLIELNKKVEKLESERNK